jgi:Ca2+-transporting ATPase
MAIGALAARVIGEDSYGEVVGATMLLTTLSLSHIMAGLSVRDETETVFSRANMPDWPQLRLFGLALLLALLVTELGLLQRIFGTTSLTLNQWLICAGIGVTILALEELTKLVLRARESSHSEAPATANA